MKIIYNSPKTEIFFLRTEGSLCQSTINLSNPLSVEDIYASGDEVELDF